MHSQKLKITKKTVPTKQVGMFIVKMVVPFLMRIFYDFQVINRQNVPRHGGVILLSNHLSHLDSFIISSEIYWRTFHYMADQRMFNIPLFGKHITKMNTYPVKKGSKSTAVVKYTIALLNKLRKGVVYYPEGHRSRTGRLHPGKIGTGWVVHATQNKVPIIPCVLYGTDQAMPAGKFFCLPYGPRKTKVAIMFGDDLRPQLEAYRKLSPSKDTSREVTNIVMKNLLRLQKNLLENYIENDYPRKSDQSFGGI